ncbi:MAG TPA: methyltransferase domain-containing protein [Bryobacteraceae bacterium]|nr:methyltransferase domain-containing protein [Bryobacteraceae bacterium]
MTLFAKRVIKPEKLDHLSPEEARPNLADLVRINSHFGGHSTILKTLARVATPEDCFTILDIGAASGDTARTIGAKYPLARVVSFDYSETNLGAAPAPKVIGNAFRLPFAAFSFDYVLCSLFLHHFEDESVVDLLHNFYELARRALLVVDLERHILPYLFLPVSKPFFGWHHVTVHDGIISVRASFKCNELVSLAERAGILHCSVEIIRPAFRLAMVAKKG